jgi:hypothetical protein
VGHNPSSWSPIGAEPSVRIVAQLVAVVALLAVVAGDPVAPHRRALGVTLDDQDAVGHVGQSRNLRAPWWRRCRRDRDDPNPQGTPRPPQCAVLFSSKSTMIRCSALASEALRFGGGRPGFRDCRVYWVAASGRTGCDCNAWPRPV